MLKLYRRAFDLKAAIGGATVMSILAALINSSHGLQAAAMAATKQGLYTFFIAGLIVRLCRRLALSPMIRIKAVAVATILPSVLTTTLIYCLHSARGTAEPLATTLVVAILSMTSFFVIALREAKATLNN